MQDYRKDLRINSILNMKIEESKYVQNLIQQCFSRFYSLQWRTWAACFIQAAWRRYRKKKADKNDSASDGFHKRKVESSISPASDKPTKKLSTRIKVLDPEGPLLQKWNKIFVITCVMAISVDSLFYYVPVINDKEKCLTLDEKLKIIACVLRTFFDLFYILRIIFQFRTGFIAPSSRMFGMAVLIDDTGAIVKRYLSSHFIIDILSIIPLPQVSASFTHSIILKSKVLAFVYVISHGLSLSEPLMIRTFR